MKISHKPAELFAAFDDPDLIAHAGLVRYVWPSGATCLLWYP
ncbi:hypothetical protein [Streptomyces variegatus]